MSNNGKLFYLKEWLHILDIIKGCLQQWSDTERGKIKQKESIN